MLRATDSGQVRTLLPNLTVVKIGGASILDRGPEAVMPVIEQLAGLTDEASTSDLRGEGARARHAYEIASDLGLPPGMPSALGKSVAEQDALIFSALLMDSGAVNVPVGLIPTLLAAAAPWSSLACRRSSRRSPHRPPTPTPHLPHRRRKLLIAEASRPDSDLHHRPRRPLHHRPTADPHAQMISQITATELHNTTFLAFRSSPSWCKC